MLRSVIGGVVDGGRLDETFIDAQHEPVETYTYGGLIAHVLTFAAHRRILVLGALESAGVPDLGNGDPRKWVIGAAWRAGASAGGYGPPAYAGALRMPKLSSGQ